MSTNGLKIAIVTPRYPPVSTGGGERSAELLATQLSIHEAVDQVTVFSFDDQFERICNGVRIVRLGSVSSTFTEYQNLRAVFNLRNRLAEFDIVHAYNMELHPAIGYLSSRYDFTTVATLNSYHFFSTSVTNTTPGIAERFYELVGHPTTGSLMIHYMRHIDAFVALSRAIEDIYRENSFKSCHIKHIPNMLDPDFDPPENEPSRDNYEILYVGSLTENKGVQYLVEAIAELSDDYRLRIVGSGDREKVLRDLAIKKGVIDYVEFSGYIPYEDITAVYGRADLFVHPGIWPEPLNRTILEAMQASLPIVCTDIGGPPEVVPDNECLCSPGDPSALAETIEHVRRSGQDLGNRNREYVLKHHDPEKIIQQILNLYKKILNDRN